MGRPPGKTPRYIADGDTKSYRMGTKNIHQALTLCGIPLSWSKSTRTRTRRRGRLSRRWSDEQQESPLPGHWDPSGPLKSQIFLKQGVPSGFGCVRDPKNQPSTTLDLIDEQCQCSGSGKSTRKIQMEK